MLDRETCERYEKYLMKEISERRARGGYSPDAPAIQFLCEMCFELLRHVRETLPSDEMAPRERLRRGKRDARNPD